MLAVIGWPDGRRDAARRNFAREQVPRTLVGVREPEARPGCCRIFLAVGVAASGVVSATSDLGPGASLGLAYQAKRADPTGDQNGCPASSCATASLVSRGARISASAAFLVSQSLDVAEAMIRLDTPGRWGY